MRLCDFDTAWVGKCGAEAIDDPVGEVHEQPPRCERHAKLKCVKCGKPATRECDMTHQLVCGVPLCDTCKHGCA